MTAYAEIDFDLDNASPAPGAVRRSPTTSGANRGRACPTTTSTRCAGPTFFDDLITHPEVEKAYDRWLDGAFLPQGQTRGSFEYAALCSRNTVASSARSTSLMLRRTSSRSEYPGCYASTTRPLVDRRASAADRGSSNRYRSHRLRCPRRSHEGDANRHSGFRLRTSERADAAAPSTPASGNVLHMFALSP